MAERAAAILTDVERRLSLRGPHRHASATIAPTRPAPARPVRLFRRRLRTTPTRPPADPTAPLDASRRSGPRTPAASTRVQDLLVLPDATSSSTTGRRTGASSAGSGSTAGRAARARAARARGARGRDRRAPGEVTAHTEGHRLEDRPVIPVHRPPGRVVGERLHRP
jgi:hypothetical protein